MTSFYVYCAWLRPRRPSLPRQRFRRECRSRRPWRPSLHEGRTSSFPRPGCERTGLKISDQKSPCRDAVTDTLPDSRLRGQGIGRRHGASHCSLPTSPWTSFRIAQRRPLGDPDGSSGCRAQGGRKQIHPHSKCPEYALAQPMRVGVAVGSAAGPPRAPPRVQQSQICRLMLIGVIEIARTCPLAGVSRSARRRRVRRRQTASGRRTVEQGLEFRPTPTSRRSPEPGHAGGKRIDVQQTGRRLPATAPEQILPSPGACRCGSTDHSPPSRI